MIGIQKVVLAGVAASLLAAPFGAAASAAPAAGFAPSASHVGANGTIMNWGRNENGIVIYVHNQKTNDNALLERPLFGNVRHFSADTLRDYMRPNTEATLYGGFGFHLLSRRPDNMDFVFTMRDRSVHGWVKVEDDGTVTANCQLDLAKQAVCYFTGTDKEGRVEDPTQPLNLHISYDKAGPQ